MQSALCELRLAAGSPRFEDLAQRPELLVALRSREQNNARRHGVEQLARTLNDVGVLAEPAFGAQPTREEWLKRTRVATGRFPQRWFRASTLSRARPLAGSQQAPAIADSPSHAKKAVHGRVMRGTGSPRSTGLSGGVNGSTALA